LPANEATLVTRVVFILSTRRAGSTWLSLVLGSHSWAANLGEYVRTFRDSPQVTCRLCEADGRAECSVLHGIDAVPPEEAFSFAAQRIPDRVLVDASKRWRWCARFAGRADLDVRVIHLVRHPAGVIESESRRRPDASHAELLAFWENGNVEIDDFVARSGLPHALVSYEALAEDPDRAFPSLCAFAGGAFEPAALRYWETPHHGLGANGASSLLLRGRARANYVTGDDAHYDALSAGATRADERWKERLPPESIRLAVTSPYARSLAKRLGRDWDVTPASR
jgi:hypothetical protein